MKIKFYLLILIISLISSCSIIQSEQNKATKLINEYARENIADYESFEIIQQSELDSLNTNVLDIELLAQYANKYQYNDSTIIFDREEIVKQKAICEKLKREYAKLTLFLADRFERNLYVFRTDLEKRNKIVRDFTNAENVIKKSDTRIKTAETENKTIKDSAMMLYNSFETKFTGKRSVLKCRFRNETGAMQIMTYDVVFDNDVTQIISFNEKIDKTALYEKLKAFVDAICKN